MCPPEVLEDTLLKKLIKYLVVIFPKNYPLNVDLKNYSELINSY
jgi:hypothetical protein